LRELLKLWRQLEILKTINELLFRYSGKKGQHVQDFIDKKKPQSQNIAKDITALTNRLLKTVNALLDQAKPI